MDILQGEVVQATADHELQKKAFEQFLSENKTALEELGVNPEEFVDHALCRKWLKKQAIQSQCLMLNRQCLKR
ncbi:MAG: hypothetical protein ABIH67_05300 [Candidatus Uhrbacteria bacterium]